MPVKRITSADNPDYREILALATDRRTRRRVGGTLLDGPHLLEAALAAGAMPRRLVFSDSAAETLSALWADRLAAVPVLVVADRLFASLTPVDTPTGLLAELALPRAGAIGGDAVVLLENIQDPGNLGALFRVAAAAGMDTVCLSPGCAEAWSPKCLRGGQGAHFLLKIHEGVDLTDYVREFSGPVFAASLEAKASLFDLDLTGRLGFAFGNEGAGLSGELCAVARPFRIPMPGRVESLNVATAAAVCLFERVRQLGA